MKSEYEKPQTTRGKVIFFIWHNMPRMIFLSLFLIIIIFGFMVGDKKSEIKAEQEAAIKTERPPVNTVVMAVEPSTISNRINLPGSIEAWNSLELISKISGSIEEVLAEEGDNVKEGQVIARIESADYEIALARAEAAYKLARVDYERDKAVYAKGVIPTAELDARETSMQTAKADLNNAKLMLERCEIKAPINGVVRRLDAKVGLYLGVGDPVGRILEIDRVKAVIGIPESDITAVRKLDSVDITIQALDDKVLTGKKHFVSSSPENTARLYRLELEIDNSDRQILPGMFTRANIIKEKRDQALAIPFYSVISRNDQKYVFVEKDGIVQQRTVSTGIMESWLVEITDGINPGDRVVVEGHRDVENDQKVKVVKVVTDPGAYSL
ncbi:MAG: efflux RND transporter periplasmic adaptor subunit [Desulfobulbaceae bacterium]|nr:MAG: efflux RND transporter periplasmic adaptor subunit [Desulfobulbaceae bacterium]